MLYIESTLTIFLTCSIAAVHHLAYKLTNARCASRKSFSCRITFSFSFRLIFLINFYNFNFLVCLLCVHNIFFLIFSCLIILLITNILLLRVFVSVSDRTQIKLNRGALYKFLWVTLSTINLKNFVPTSFSHIFDFSICEIWVRESKSHWCRDRRYLIG